MKSHLNSIQHDIQAEAYRLGFSLFGMADPSPKNFYIYQAWLNKGRHGGMSYLARPDYLVKRADPHLLYTSARSVLIFAIPYAAPFPENSQLSPLTGQIASYARHLDYHEVLRSKLNTLVECIQTRYPEVHFSQAFSDSAPIAERDLAHQAGLGWIGKNSCLIHPKMGSTFFLAELFSDLEPEVEAQTVTDHCGSCTRCISACPMGCIQTDRTLDARRCISYLTIEHKGPIAPELRSKMGNWVFGCDICQRVCPWNERFASRQVDPAFTPQPQFNFPNLLETLKMTPEAFAQVFCLSPIRRARRRGYLRNVAIALGNTHDPIGIPALQSTLLNEREPLIRGAAAWALTQMNSPIARIILQQAETHETDPYVLAEIRSEDIPQ